jgi:hypothetical protein
MDDKQTRREDQGRGGSVTGADLVKLREQLRADVLELVTKTGPDHSPVTLDMVTDHVMLLVDIYTASVRESVQRRSAGLK